MSEASIMGQFRHPNVILLVGVVTISTYSVYVFVYSFVCILLLFLLFVCLFLSFSRIVCVINAWQETILSCTWARAHISSLIFRDPCTSSLVFLRLLCHSMLLAYSWKFNQLLKLPSFYLLKLIFACGLTRISVSKNGAITPLTLDLPNCQEYVMTSLVLWIQGVFFLRARDSSVSAKADRSPAKGRRYKWRNRNWKPRVKSLWHPKGRCFVAFGSEQHLWKIIIIFFQCFRVDTAYTHRSIC